MTSNSSMIMPNTNSTTNSSQISEIVCTPTILFPTFQALDARQTLSGFLPVCNSNQQPTQQQPIGKFTKTQQKNQIKTVDSSSSNQQSTGQLISSTINPSTLTNHTITIQHQPLQSNTTQLMQNGQNKFTGTTTIMIPTNSNQIKTSHLNNNGELVWSCPSCKLPCKTASELQNHLNVHTKTEKSVPCDQCGKLFVSQERVKIHIKVSHGVKSSVCPICNSSFTYKCKLADHMRTHTGDKPFQCDVCLRRFKQKSHVSRHKMIHTGEKPFICEVCNKGFYRKDKLSRHRLIHLNPQSRKSKQQAQITNNNQQNNGNNNESNNNTSSINSLNAITNGSLISNDLINSSNALTNNNTLFQTTNSSNDNLLNSNTATIQLIPVQLTQQWIAAQNNLNTSSINNLNSINSLNNNLNNNLNDNLNNSNQQETMNSNNNSNNNPMNSNCT